MAILFEWYETPVPNNETDETEKTTIHARITLNGKVGTDEIRRKIQKRSSLTETDVSAVLDALSHVMGEELSEGRQVHLDGIGYFYPTLKSEKGITRETDRKNEKVRLKGIKFRADRALKDRDGQRETEKHSGTAGTPVNYLSRDRYAAESVFCRTPTDDTCRFPAYMRLYAVESSGAPETAECGRKDRKYRKKDTTDICAGSRILWSQPGSDRNEISPQKTPFHTLCPMNKGTQRCGRGICYSSSTLQTCSQILFIPFMEGCPHCLSISRRWILVTP